MRRRWHGATDGGARGWSEEGRRLEKVLLRVFKMMAGGSGGGGGSSSGGNGHTRRQMAVKIEIKVRIGARGSAGRAGDDAGSAARVARTAASVRAQRRARVSVLLDQRLHVVARKRNHELTAAGERGGEEKRD